MKTSDFTNPLTSIKLRENLEKQFNTRVNLEDYDRVELEDIRNKLRTRVFQQESSAGVNELLTNEAYQKDKAMLQLLNTKIKEMLGEAKKAGKIDEDNEIPIGVRSLYTKMYAKHGGTLAQSKNAAEKAYAEVEKKYGKEMADKLKAYHKKNYETNEDYNPAAVDKAIKSSNKPIGKKEAGNIHRLLKGRHEKPAKTDKPVKEEFSNTCKCKACGKSFKVEKKGVKMSECGQHKGLRAVRVMNEDAIEDDKLYVINTKTNEIISGPYDNAGEIPLRLMGYDGGHKVLSGGELKVMDEDLQDRVTASQRRLPTGQLASDGKPALARKKEDERDKDAAQKKTLARPSKFSEEHDDGEEDKKLIKKMVKKDCMKEDKSMGDLSDEQWAKIHGTRAGHRGYPSRHNPYDPESESKLRDIWYEAHREAMSKSHPSAAHGYRGELAEMKDEYDTMDLYIKNPDYGTPADIFGERNVDIVVHYTVDEYSPEYESGVYIAEVEYGDPETGEVISIDFDKLSKYMQTRVEYEVIDHLESQRDSSDEYEESTQVQSNKEYTMNESKKTFKQNVKIVNESIKYLLAEDKEEEAKTITAAGDMVNDFTSWMQRVGQYQTKVIVDLSDAIKKEFGAQKAQEFRNTVEPSLDAALSMLTSQREVLSNAVAVLAGSASAEPMMGAEPPMTGDDEDGMPEMEPADADQMNEPKDEFSASDAAGAGREMRESSYARKLRESHSILSKLAKR